MTRLSASDHVTTAVLLLPIQETWPEVERLPEYTSDKIAPVKAQTLAPLLVRYIPYCCPRPSSYLLLFSVISLQYSFVSCRCRLDRQGFALVSQLIELNPKKR